MTVEPLSPWAGMLLDMTHRGGPSRHDRDHDAGVAVLTLHDDERELARGQLRGHLGRLLETGPSTLVLDLSAVRHLSSDGIDGLLWLRQRCLGRAVRIVVRQPSRQSVELLRRTGLLGMLTIEDPTPHVQPQPVPRAVADAPASSTSPA